MQGSFPGLSQQLSERRSIHGINQLQHLWTFGRPLGRVRLAAKSTKCRILDSNSASVAVVAVEGERPLQVEQYSTANGSTFRVDVAWFGIKERRAIQPQLSRPVLAEHPQGCQAVFDATAEIDAAGFVEVADGHRDVADFESEMDGLGQKLAVEYEVIGVRIEGNGLQDLAPVGSKTTVEVTQVLPEGDILDQRQAAIGDVLPSRHSTGQRFVPGPDARPHDKVASSQSDDFDGHGDGATVILVIGVDHDHDIGAVLKGVPVTRLLVTTVAEVLLVPDDGQPQSFCNFDCVISAAVIDDDDFVDGSGRDVLNSSL